MRDAAAAPMHTALTTVRADATTIVIGVVRSSPKGFEVDVERVVRGTANVGAPLPVLPSPDGSISPSRERVIAFIDKTGALRWVGEKIAGPSLEKGVLRLSGFFDFNAHLVSPGVMSLAELERFLATGKLQQTFAVTMSFPDGRGARKPSSRSFTVERDALDAQAAVVLKGLAIKCLGTPTVFSPDWGSFTVMLSDTCGVSGSSKFRSLRLEGKFVGLDAKGALVVDATPERPAMTEPEFETFAADGDIVDVVRVVRVAVDQGPPWTWLLGEALVDPTGAKHAPTSTSMESRTVGGVMTSKAIYGFDGVTLTMSPSTRSVSSGGGALVVSEHVDGKRVDACTVSRPSMPDRPCKLTSGKPIFVRR